MSQKCSNCRLVNFPDAKFCARCDALLINIASAAKEKRSLAQTIVRRGIVCFIVCLAVLAGFYLSLIVSAKKLSFEERNVVRQAISTLDEKGFSHETFLLRNLTAFRTNDNWLNASVEKENAYAATNFPFELMTLYPDFFAFTVDDVERAAILLHEAKHLEGKNEHDAYEFVWKNRKTLGWVKEKYSDSKVWQDVRRQTRDNVPTLFVCNSNEFADCTD